MHDGSLPLLKRLLKSCADVSKLTTFGRRHQGYYATLPSGKKVYIVVRRNMQMYRGKEYSQTDAIQKRTAAWMIDKEVLRTIQKAGVEYLIFFTKDAGEFFVSSISKWFDSSIAKDEVLRAWGETRHLGVHHMAKTTIYSKGTVR